MPKLRSRVFAVLAAVVVAGCHSTTAPAVNQSWGYEAPALTDGVVTCIFGATLVLTTTSGPFTGTYTNGYMSCSGPNGASSTLVSGTVDSGTVTGSTVSFDLTNTDVSNSGEVAEVTSAFTSSGTIVKRVLMTGTATVNITLGGQPHTLTGTWRAPRR